MVFGEFSLGPHWNLHQKSLLVIALAAQPKINSASPKSGENCQKTNRIVPGYMNSGMGLSLFLDLVLVGKKIE